jgi:hypothetical protein
LKGNTSSKKQAGHSSTVTLRVHHRLRTMEVSKRGKCENVILDLPNCWLGVGALTYMRSGEDEDDDGARVGNVLRACKSLGTSK